MAQVTRQPFVQLFGGLNKAATDVLVRQSPDGPLQSPDTLNAEFDKIGGVAKRNGKSQQGNDITAGNWYDQLSVTQTPAASGDIIADDGVAFCQGISAPTTNTIDNVTVNVSVNQTNGVATAGNSFDANLFMTIRADAAGSPGSVVSNGTSNIINAKGYTTDLRDYTFTFAIPPSLTSGTTYWFCVEYQVTGSSTFSGLLRVSAASAGANLKSSTDKMSTFSSVTGELYIIVIAAGATSNAIQGVFDYQVDTGSGVFAQRVMGAVGGTLYYKPGPVPLTGAWTSLTTGFASGQDVLFDFSVANNYLFITDYANNTNRVWDGSTAFTIPHGYRGDFTPTAGAGSGAWTATGDHEVLFVTTLVSGGYRTQLKTVNLSATNQHIDVDSVTVNNTSSQFGFDISGDTTRVFIKTPGMTEFHVLLVGQMANFTATPGNPIEISETSFDINGAADATLNAQDTLLDIYEVGDAYFTLQVDTPKFKFMQTGDGFLTGAGDPDHPSRWWVSALNAPQVWSEAGGTDGTFYEVGAENDGQDIVGIKYAMGAFFIFKTRDVYRFKFTGDANQPFVSEKLPSNDVSCLSHFAIEEIPQGILFPSVSGMAICNGARVDLFGDNEIGNLFESDDATGFNLGPMSFTTSMNHTNKQQVWYGVSSKSASTRDQVLIYDYHVGAWTLHNGIAGNYFTKVSDANGFSQPWSGDYTGKIFQHDTGTNDDGSIIEWIWETPNFVFGDVDGWTRLNRVSIKGDVQSSGTLLVDVYTDYSTTSTFTMSFDMTDTRFVKGLDLPLNAKGQAIRLRFRNAELDVPVQIQAITLYFQSLGSNK